MEKNRARMELLDCPFNWGFGCGTIDEYNYLDNSNVEDQDEDSLIPLVRLMGILMKVYVACHKVETTVEEDQRIFLDLKKRCDTLLSSIRKSDTDQNFSRDVIRHIIQATRAFVYSKKQMMLEMEEALSNIKPIDLSNNRARSTLYGCKGICWGEFGPLDSDESEKYMRKAISDNQNCHLWYFVLGRILREKRRHFTFGSLPKKEEEDCFTKAYSLSNNQVYGLFFGQMFREKCLTKDAEICLSENAIRIYEQIFQQNPKNTEILLRLALGFISFKDMKKAGECFDKISEPPEGHPARSMYLHYKGKYHLKLGEHWMAAKFLQEAAKDYNIAAGYQYMGCMRRVDSNFDTSQYLLEMIEKYRDFPEKLTQRTLLLLAISYWKKDNSIEDSLSCFIKALAVDPKSEIFTNCNTFEIGVRLPDENIFTIIETEFLPLVYQKYSSEYIMKMADTLKKYCSDYQTSLHKSAPPARPLDLPRLNYLMENLFPKRAEQTRE